MNTENHIKTVSVPFEDYTKMIEAVEFMEKFGNNLAAHILLTENSFKTMVDIEFDLKRTPVSVSHELKNNDYYKGAQLYAKGLHKIIFKYE